MNFTGQTLKHIVNNDSHRIIQSNSMETVPSAKFVHANQEAQSKLVPFIDPFYYEILHSATICCCVINPYFSMKSSDPKYQLSNVLHRCYLTCWVHSAACFLLQTSSICSSCVSKPPRSLDRGIYKGSGFHYGISTGRICTSSVLLEQYDVFFKTRKINLF